MELEVARLERMKKHMQDMCDENDTVAKAEAAKKAPFQGTGFRLGDDLPSQPKPPPSIDRQIIPPPPHIEVDSLKPTTNIQVRSSDGSRLVVKLNQSHTVADLKQEILSRQETREGRTSFALISVGPPPKPLINE